MNLHVAIKRVEQFAYRSPIIRSKPLLDEALPAQVTAYKYETILSEIPKSISSLILRSSELWGARFNEDSLRAFHLEDSAVLKKEDVSLAICKKSSKGFIRTVVDRGIDSVNYPISRSFVNGETPYQFAGKNSFQTILDGARRINRPNPTYPTDPTWEGITEVLVAQKQAVRQLTTELAVDESFDLVNPDSTQIRSWRKLGGVSYLDMSEFEEPINLLLAESNMTI